jgi:hypothetical protein
MQLLSPNIQPYITQEIRSAAPPKSTSLQYGALRLFKEFDSLEKRCEKVLDVIPV